MSYLASVVLASLLLACWFSTAFACSCTFSSSIYEYKNCTDAGSECSSDAFDHMQCTELSASRSVMVDCVRRVAFYYNGTSCEGHVISTLVDGMCVISDAEFRQAHWDVDCEGNPTPNENCEAEETAYEEEYSDHPVCFVSAIADMFGEFCAVNATFTTDESCEFYGSTLSFGADCQRKLLFTYFSWDCSGAPYVAAHNLTTFNDYEGANEFPITPSFGADCDGRPIVIPEDGSSSSSGNSSEESSSNASNDGESSNDGQGSSASALRSFVDFLL
ncbi:hypothetical protein QOT17_020996 [Balamuthia mandrillaris]